MGDSSSSRGKLPFGQPTGDTTRAEGPNKSSAFVEPATITAGGIKRTIQDATRPLSLEQRFIDKGEIGRGGMGAVHRVHERSIGRTVALKFLPQERAVISRNRDRFLAEAQITGQLEHPNIIPVYEIGRDDEGTYFFTMRLVEGATLTEFLEQGDDEDHLEQALEVFLRASDALSFAHSRGVLHRDVKPSNIMVGEHGQVYLMDWGIAFVSDKLAAETMSGEGDASGKTTTLTTLRIDDRGLVVGTYAYMSPEQARGDQDAMDARTDVFGLGAVLYRIVTGRPPFLGKNASETLDLATKCLVPDKADEVEGRLRKELLRVAGQALQRDPDQRFQSVEALKRAVQSVLRGRQRFPSTTYAEGTPIVLEGESGDDAFFIKSGRCRVYREVDGEKRSLRMLGPGDVFGETAVFTNQPRNASVEALTDAELIVVPGRALGEALGLDSWMGAFVRSLGTRFSERSRRVMALDVAQARGRTAQQALAHLVREGLREIDLAELASAIGAEPTSVEEAVAASAVLTLTGGVVSVV